MAEDVYTGDVVVGGPSQARRIGGLTLRKLAVGPMANNVYLLTCETQGAQALVDPATDPDALLEFVRLGSGSARLDQIIVTHRHADHIGALESLSAVTGAPVAAGAEDADSIEEQTGVRVATRLRDGDTVRIGDCALGVIHLRGHTPGSIALVITSDDGAVHVLTGDSLFPGGVGKTESSEDFTSLINDVEERIFERFDDRTWVYPGHGRDTTLTAERNHVQQWRDRGW